MGAGSIIGSVLGGIAGSFVGQPVAGAAIGGSIGGSFDESGGGDNGGGNTDISGGNTNRYSQYGADLRFREQQDISSLIANILKNGGKPYTGPRVAQLSPLENQTQSYMTNALTTAAPGINRLLSGQFPEEAFNQAVTNPALKTLNQDVLPMLRANSEITGNRFASQTAVSEGRAAGDTLDSIIRQRGQLTLDTLRDPINTLGSLSTALTNVSNIGAVPRNVEQAELDTNYSEFLRTDPASGGLLPQALQFLGAPGQTAVDQVGPFTQAYLASKAGGGGNKDILGQVVGAVTGGGGNTGNVIQQTQGQQQQGGGTNEMTALAISALMAQLFG